MVLLLATTSLHELIYQNRTVCITLLNFDPFKEGGTDRNYPGLQFGPIERRPRPACLFFFEKVVKDKVGMHGVMQDFLHQKQ